MTRTPPRLLAPLLALVVIARVGIVFIVHSPLHTALGWAALLGVLGGLTLLGRRLAADALAWLCLILGADTLIQLLQAGVPPVHLAAALTWASIAIGTGLYLLRSGELRRFLARQRAA